MVKGLLATLGLQSRRRGRGVCRSHEHHADDAPRCRPDRLVRMNPKPFYVEPIKLVQS